MEEEIVGSRIFSERQREALKKYNEILIGLNMKSCKSVLENRLESLDKYTKSGNNIDSLCRAIVSLHPNWDYFDIPANIVKTIFVRLYED